MVFWDGEEPFYESAHSSVCEDSELNDPQYDQSLLENLFYKTPVSGLFLYQSMPVNLIFFHRDFLKLCICFFQMLDIRESDTEAKDRKESSCQQQVTQSGQEISRG